MEFAPIFGPCRTSPSVCGTGQAKSRICFVRNAFFGSKRSVAGPMGLFRRDVVVAENSNFATYDVTGTITPVYAQSGCSGAPT